jgi:signal transduction histidine kinase
MKKIKSKNRKTSRSRGSVAVQTHAGKGTKGVDSQVILEVLSGICQLAEQSTGEKQAFEKMLNMIGKAVEFSRASLFIINQNSRQMEEVASIGRKVDLIDSIRFDAGLGLSAWVAKEKRPILLSDLQRKKGGDGIKSFLTIPCLLNGELFGVMNFGHIHAYAFEPEDVRILTLTSLPITLNMERRFYFKETERLKRELNQAREEIKQLEVRVNQMQTVVPTAQLLENLNEKIRTPLDSITENAEFLLKGITTHPDDKSTLHSKKELSVQFRKGLKEIRNDVNQITKATEKILRKGNAGLI